jgi:HEAT repeat protein
LDDNHKQVRYYALQGLINSAQTAMPVILEFIKGKKKFNPKLLVVLGHTGKFSAALICLPYLEHKQAAMRAAACRALGLLRMDLAFSALQDRLLLDTNFGVRGAAARALGHLKNKRSLELLIFALGGEYRFVTDYVVSALVEMGPYAVKPLGQALINRQRPRAVRSFAAFTLGEIGDERALPFLIKAMQMGDFYVVNYAYQSLKKISGQTFPRQAKVWQQWYDRSRQK